MRNPYTNLFSVQQWRNILSLVDELNISQTQWLSDYLKQLSNKVSDSRKPISNKRIAVAYGSETGNCKSIAELFVKTALKQNKPIELVNLADVKIRQLGNFQKLFIVCSTHGDGDPPEPIESFYSSLLLSDKNLEELHYAVLSLGDSSYDKFCETGRQIDKKLTQLKAVRLFNRIDCDVDFEEQAEQWIEESVTHITSSQVAPVVRVVANDELPTVSKNNPLEVEVLENLCLSASSRENAIHHLELGLNQKGFEIASGDSIGVFPNNSPSLVSRILEFLSFSGDESVSVRGQAMPLVQALREDFDLTIVSVKFVKKWAQITDHQDLKKLSDSSPKDIRTYLKNHHLIDFLRLFGGNTDPQTFVETLRPLQPRLYDVASSQALTPGELHLTVERHTYQLNGISHNGTASHFLCDLDEGDTVFIYPQHNKRFQLPLNPAVPMILIADGTGIAPYRAFLQELEADESRQHQVWLILRERTFSEDFLYQLEWQTALDKGTLTRLNLVFHIDNPGETLFDPIAENYEIFKGWLKAGAHLYLSGHKNPLNLLQDALTTAFNSDPSITEEWKRMSEAGRIHRNLY